VATQPRAALADPAGPADDGHDRQLTWVVRALCLTQIVGWGILYYAFPVLATSIEFDTGWSKTAVTAAFSAALLVAAGAGILVGRAIQRHGPRWVMSAGSLLGTLAVVAVALAPNFAVFVLAWLIAGVAMSATLYAPAFAAITVWFGAHRVRALTAVTLIAGLASTIFAPLTAALNDHVGWRETYLVLAAVLALTTVPTHWIALRPSWPDAQPQVAATTSLRSPSPVSRREFALLAAGFALAATAFYAVLIDIVPLVQARGFSAGDAAIVLGVGGIGQVAGRLAYARLSRHLSVRARTAGVLAIGATTTGLLALITGPLLALLLASILAGYARGIFTLLEATAVSDRWGTSRFARLNGIFNAPLMIATAIAPFVGAGLADVLGSYPHAFELLMVAGLVAAGLTAVSSTRIEQM
jgi:MFS family permease